MNWTQVASVAAFLIATLPLAALAQKKTSRTQVDYATGKESYEKRCALCHQPDGAGRWSETGGFPPLSGLSEWMALPEGRLYVTRAIIFGPYGEVQVGDKVYIGMMPRFGPRMSDAELVLVVRYIGETLNKPAPGYVPIDESVVVTARGLPDAMKALEEARDQLPMR